MKAVQDRPLKLILTRRFILRVEPKTVPHGAYRMVWLDASVIMKIVNNATSALERK